MVKSRRSAAIMSAFPCPSVGDLTLSRIARMPNGTPLTQQGTLLGGKYRLGPVIGSGGVASVYRATHAWTEREVAVKVLDPTLPHFDRVREGFLREARATVQLDHPNVVDVLDMGEDNWETAYLVMELLEGPTLRDLLLEQGRLDADDTVAILLPLINALEKAHALGIVHRDFKPENIMLTLDSYGVVTPKLLDFGVAEILRDARSQIAASRGGVIMGTPQYMAPEQARDQRELIGPQTDVWGVGVVWYECLTGRCPFDGDSAPEVLRAVCESEVDFDGVPEAFVPLLRHALVRSTEERFSSLSELKSHVEDMGVAVASTPPPAPRLSSWPPPATNVGAGQPTLTGLGPKARLPIQGVPTQLDSELLHVPLSSHRKQAIGGLALALAVGLSAWWTVRDPSPASQAEPELLSTEAASDTLPVRSEAFDVPSAAPSPATADERKMDPPTADAAAIEAPEPAPRPAATSSGQASTPPPRKARPRSKPPRRRVSTPANDPKYEPPPELVTTW
jgi:serine/threonine protein kinase